MEHLKDIVSGKTDEELLQMVYDIDEWGAEMLQQVEHELNTRDILPTDIAQRTQEKIDAEDLSLRQGKDASIGGLFLGWITCFGFLGIFIGYQYANATTKSRYTGKRYYTYNATGKKQRKYLLVASSVLTAVGILAKLSQ
jgi:hypothetical protein